MPSLRTFGNLIVFLGGMVIGAMAFLSSPHVAEDNSKLDDDWVDIGKKPVRQKTE